MVVKRWRCRNLLCGMWMRTSLGARERERESWWEISNSKEISGRVMLQSWALCHCHRHRVRDWHSILQSGPVLPLDSIYHKTYHKLLYTLNTWLQISNCELHFLQQVLQLLHCGSGLSGLDVWIMCLPLVSLTIKTLFLKIETQNYLLNALQLFTSRFWGRSTARWKGKVSFTFLLLDS